MIHFKCPTCGKGIKVGDASAGKDGKCPACAATVHVPNVPVAVAEGPPPLRHEQRRAVAPDELSPAVDEPTEQTPADVPQAEPISAPGPTRRVPTFLTETLGRLHYRKREVGIALVALVVVAIGALVLVYARLGSREADAKPATTPRPLVERPALSSPWAGFRGIAWKTRIEDLPDMELVSEKDCIYMRSAEVLNIGDARLTWIMYSFHKSQFYRVMVRFEGESNWKPLRDAIFIRYKEGKETDAGTGVESYYWRSGDVMMFLTWDGATGLWQITYKPLESERTEDNYRRDVERAKKAASEL